MQLFSLQCDKKREFIFRGTFRVSIKTRFGIPTKVQLSERLVHHVCTIKGPLKRHPPLNITAILCTEGFKDNLQLG